MKKTKDEIICYVLFVIAIVLLLIAGVTGLMGENFDSIEKICLYLGNSLTCFGFVFLFKSKKDNSGNNGDNNSEFNK